MENKRKRIKAVNRWCFCVTKKIEGARDASVEKIFAPLPRLRPGSLPGLLPAAPSFPPAPPTFVRMKDVTG